MIESNVDEQRERRELSEDALEARLESAEVGDELLFNDRKIPLKVMEKTDKTVKIEGPRGGEYVLSISQPKVSSRAYEDKGRTVNPVINRELWWVEILVE